MNLVAIRGATTVGENEYAKIMQSTKRLLQEMLQKNRIKDHDIISIFFTCTPDLDAGYPAKAARDLISANMALFCCQEMNVPNNLPKCIRILMQTLSQYDQNSVQHVYLNDARKLRPDLMIKSDDLISHINIAIDGPAGAGKSTIAKEIAKRKKIIYLDTGAMYRAAALKAIRCGFNIKEEADKIIQLMDNTEISIVYQEENQNIFLDDENVTGLIRTPVVSQGASDIAAIPKVRLKLVELQRKIAQDHDVVMDGRDIGTFVIPTANFKFYITASIEERARRRWIEMQAMGHLNTLDEIMADIETRDFNDKNRSFAPLCMADDAILIDTSFLSIQDAVEEVLQKIQ